MRRFAIAAALLFAALPAGWRTPAQNVITVGSGQDLQAALNQAQPGDEIVVEAGATFVGNFTLPVKPGSSFVTVRSSRCAELPAGKRVSPADAPLMARLSTPNAMPTLYAPPGSHHWRLRCLEVTQGPELPADGFSYSLVHIGEGAASQKTAADTPRHIELDRVIVRTRDDRTAAQRGVLLNAAHASVTNSHISGIKWAGVEAQAVAGWNGQGPLLIENNYLEAAGVNVLFGGANPASADLIPSDIVIRNNHLFKPLTWRIGDPAYAGTPWTVKNLLEFKNGRRVLVEGNTLENSWAMSQTGWAVIVNIGSDSMPNVGDDIVMRGNTFRNVSNGINLKGGEATDPAKIHRLTFSDNLMENLGAYGGEGKAFQVLAATEGVAIDHNTVGGRVRAGLVLEAGPGQLHVGLAFTNNLLPWGNVSPDYGGVFGDGGTLGADAMRRYASGWALAGNAFVGTPAWARAKLPDDFFPATFEEAAGLVGTDGRPVGVRAAGQPTPTPPPGTPTPTPPTPTPTPVPPPPSPTPTPSPVKSQKPCKAWPPWKWFSC